MRSSARATVLFVALIVFGGCGSSANTPPPSVPAGPSSTAAASLAVPSASPSTGPSCAPTPEAIAGMSAVKCTVPAPSLANNLLGDPAELETEILLPADYETSGRRYPSVYVLAGWNDDAGFIAYQLGRGLTAAVAADAEAVYVMVGGLNALGGSFYVNSSVTGNWEDAIANDLVAFVDGAYRTLPAAASRGMAGHSMGGFGALSIALHRPDVFGAVYAMSPGLFGPNGAKNRLGDDSVFAPIVELADKLAGQPAAARAKGLIGGGTGWFDIAYGAAFVPDPTAAALMTLPYKYENGRLVLDQAVWRRWDDGFGGIPAKLAAYQAKPRQLRAIGIDYGIYDEYEWIPEGCKTFVGLATQAGLPVTEASFEGDHQGSLDTRMADVMIPFFTQNLVR
jgi:S-formylglutathione hydrolase